MFLRSRRVVVVLLALLAATALLAPAEAATTDSMTTDSAADQETASTSDMTMDVDEEDTDEPVDSGLECSDDFAADGQCDDMNNTAACGYDGGDCCLCTCVPTADFNCGGNYDCIDPDAECVDDDDGDGGVLTTLTIETDDVTEEMEDAEETNTDDTDSATGTRPSSFISAAGLAAAAGSAVLLAGWGV